MNTVSEQAFLFIEEGELTGTKILLDKPHMVIGRVSSSEQCDIALPERQISRQHAEIYWDKGRFFLRDLDSKNGTYLNGRPVKGAQPLQDNDEIQFALCVRARFIGSDATLPLERVQIPKELHLDRESHRVWVGPQEVIPPLSPAQYRLLELLTGDVGRVYSREEVVAVVWAEEEEQGVTEQAIDALVRRLRERLAEIAPDRQYVVTVRGHGFRLDPTGRG
jgi:DNA-binding winged helix-turn-helix (wHTH) protein